MNENSNIKAFGAASKDEDLKEKKSKYVDDVISIENIEEAVNYTLRNSKKEDIIISAGSLYMIGAVRTIVNNTLELAE